MLFLIFYDILIQDENKNSALRFLPFCKYESYSKLEAAI